MNLSANTLAPTQDSISSPVPTPPRRESLVSPRRLHAQERKLRVLECRQAGESYASIAKKLGISAEGARKTAIKAFEELRSKTVEMTENARALDLLRLDTFLGFIWSDVEAGDVKAQQQALRIMEMRVKLLGLEVNPKDALEAEKDARPKSMVHVYIPDNGRDKLQYEA